LEDKKTAKTLNSFKYTNDSACPLSAHTRKTNPRETDTNNPQSIRARIVRNGIPYGSEFSDKPGEARGLLFACYQSRIEDGFRFIQQAWANNVDFPERDAGHDPIIGQSSDRQLSVTITNAENLPRKLPPLAEMVTLKGGDYFFVPSISALQTTLGQD
jgi:Dyp-type peroxidase family